jgi:hypothetical protein
VGTSALARGESCSGAHALMSIAECASGQCNVLGHTVHVGRAQLTISIDFPNSLKCSSFEITNCYIPNVQKFIN